MPGSTTLISYAAIVGGSLPRERYPAAALSGVLTYIGWARRAIVGGDMPAAHDALLAAQQILALLRGSLESKADAELVARLDGLYAYVQDQLVRANLEKSDTLLTALGPIVMTLRDAWEEAAQLALAAPVA